MTDERIERLLEEVKEEMEPNHAENTSLRVEFLGWDPEDAVWKFRKSSEFDD